MKTCGSCKHWGKQDEVESSLKAGFKKCYRIIHDEHSDTDDYKDDVYDKDDPYDAQFIARMNATRKELAVVKDGSGYYAALKCREDFGCVLHEEK
jgi:hypothetical protein